VTQPVDRWGTQYPIFKACAGGAECAAEEVIMEDREPTVRSRELGEGLRRAMRDAGLSGKDVARLLDLSPSWVSRLISGKRNVTAVQASAFLAVCRTPSAERERLLELCDEQHTPGWFQQHGSQLPLQLVTLIDHENKAISYSDIQPMLVPGLLQTGDYARALLKEAGRVPAEEIDDRVAARLARQALFSRNDPARFTFYLHEFVLRLPVGGPAVMADRLDLLGRMSRRPYLTLRVVPATLGAHAATAGPFHPHGVRRVQAGGVPGERDLQPVPGAAGGNRRLPGHSRIAGADRPG
jgi:transcriptional regulator with XRE-family HTH domain